MRRRLIWVVSASALAATVFAFSAQSGAQDSRATFGARCLHGNEESRVDRDRRDRAVSLAKAINAAQGQAMDQTKRYQLLPQLRALPVTPDGFRVRLYSDGEGYIFSIKDERDACRYGIFSDQHGTLYESSPIVPQIAS